MIVLWKKNHITIIRERPRDQLLALALFPNKQLLNVQVLRALILLFQFRVSLVQTHSPKGTCSTFTKGACSSKTWHLNRDISLAASASLASLLSPEDHFLELISSQLARPSHLLPPRSRFLRHNKRPTSWSSWRPEQVYSKLVLIWENQYEEAATTGLDEFCFTTSERKFWELQMHCSEFYRWPIHFNNLHVFVTYCHYHKRDLVGYSPGSPYNTIGYLMGHSKYFLSR